VLVLLDNRQIAERCQLAVRLPPRDVLAAGHEIEDIVGEEIEPLLEPALVEQPGLADVDCISSSQSVRCAVSDAVGGLGWEAAGGRRLVRASSPDRRPAGVHIQSLGSGLCSGDFGTRRELRVLR
jgi:hypothetical protein